MVEKFRELWRKNDIPTLLETKGIVQLKFCRQNEKEKLFFSGVLYSIALEGKRKRKSNIKGSPVILFFFRYKTKTTKLSARIVCITAIC